MNAVAVAELGGRSVVISGSDDGTVQVSELVTGMLIGKLFTGRITPVNAVAVAELDGRPIVISAGWDRIVRVWELASGSLIGKPFNGHTAPVNTVTVAELDGRSVVISGSDDATVRLWDLEKGRPIRDIQRAVRLRHSAPVLTAVVQQRRDVCMSIQDAATEPDGLRIFQPAARSQRRLPSTEHRSTLLRYLRRIALHSPPAAPSSSTAQAIPPVLRRRLSWSLRWWPWRPIAGQQWLLAALWVS